MLRSKKSVKFFEEIGGCRRYMSYASTNARRRSFGIGRCFCRGTRSTMASGSFPHDARLAVALNRKTFSRKPMWPPNRESHIFLHSQVSLMVWLRSIVLQTMVDLYRQHLGAQSPSRNASLDVSLNSGADAPIPRPVWWPPSRAVSRLPVMWRCAMKPR